MTKPLLCGFLQVMSGLKPPVFPLHARRHALSPHIHLPPPRLTRPSLRPPIRPPVRACVYILCVFLPPLFSFKKSCSATCLSISHLWKSFDISGKKGFVYLVRIPKSATFASAFENEGGDSLTFWQKRSRNPFLFSCYLVLFVSWIPPLKRKMKKNFRFIWSIWNKVLTFAPAFKMRAALFDNLFETRAVTTVLFLCSSFRKRDDLKKEKK